MCRTQKFREKKGEKKNRTRRMKVRQAEENSDQENGDYTFVVSNDYDSDNSKILVKAGGVNMDMLIDPGASCNIIDRETWERLKNMKIKCKSSAQRKYMHMEVHNHLRWLEHFGLK